MGDGGAGNEARRARREEEARQQRISQGTQRIRGSFADTFNTKYYSDLMQKMKDAYLPGVNDQYQKAYQQLQGALMRSGLGESSVAAAKEKESTKAYNDALTQVDQRGIQAQNQRKLDIDSTQNQVIGQLTNTADSAAAQAATQAALTRESSPQAIPPLGQIFQDFTAGLQTQAELERQGGAKYNVFGRIPGWNNQNRYTTNISGR